MYLDVFDWDALTRRADKDEESLKVKAGIIVPLATFFSVGLLCIFVFCIVRGFFKDIYAPRRSLAGGRPPKLPKGFLAWLPALLRMPEPLLVTQVGLDGVALLRFFKMGAQMFAVLSFFGLSMIAPVNYYANPPRYHNSTGILYEDILIPALTVENVPRRSRSLWVHLFFTWFFSFVAYAYLIAFYRGLVDLKTNYVEHVLRRTHMSKIEMRSIIVFGIPRELRHEVDLASYFEGLGLGNVENVVLCRKWSHLRNAVQKRAHYLTKLEKTYADVMRNLLRRRRRQSGRGAALPIHREPSAENGQPPSISFDPHLGIGLTGGNHARHGSRDSDEAAAGADDGDYDDLDQASRPLLSVPRRFSTSSGPGDGSLFELMSRLDAVDPRNRPKHRTGFMGLRGPLVDSADYYADKFQEWDRKVARMRKDPEASAATSAGFVTFESPESAILASQVLIHRRPFACMARLAPEPRDVFWVNLSSKVADSYIKVFRSVAVTGTLFLLVFLSTGVVTSVTALISLSTFPALEKFLSHLGQGWLQFIQGVIPAVVTAAWTSSLPSVLILLAQAQGLEAQSWIDASVLSKYFFYQIWNILFVQTVAHQLWESRYDIIRSGPGEIVDALGLLIPRAASVQINYVMLQATAVYPAQLLLVGPLIITWLTRFLSLRRSTPREVSDAYYPSVLTSINYGIAYPVPILVFCVGLTYAPVAPLILPFCAFFFGIAWFVYKYLLLYVNIPRYETGGKHAPMAVRRCLAGIFIMQLSMMGVLALKAGTGLVGNPGDGDNGDDDDDLFGGTGFLQSEKKRLHWSGYVQMVVGVGPLLIITGLMYWWFKHGFEKLINHIPLDIVGSVAREFASRRGNAAEAEGRGVSGKAGAGTGVNRGERVVVGEVETGEELAPVSSTSRPRASSGGARAAGGASSSSATAGTAPAVSKRVSIRATRGRVRKASTATADGRSFDTTPLEEAELHDGLAVGGSRNTRTASASPSRGTPVSSFSPPAGSDGQGRFYGSISSSPQRFEDGIDTGRDSMRADDFYFQSFAEDVERGDGEARRSNGMRDDGHNDEADAGVDQVLDIEDADDRDDEAQTIHLEPPMTRVPGVLDAPFVTASAIVPAGDEGDQQDVYITSPASGGRGNASEDDLQMHTYVHPALIGRLPIPWVPGEVQPRRCREAREEMSRSQRGLYGRIVGRQRVGVSALGGVASRGGDEANEETGEEDADSSLRGPGQRRRGPVRRHSTSVGRKVMSFVDGVTAWAHLSMS
ncbi:hypothetical protein BDZ88DRAFT_502106 [Geranomyces variabilis]|nr:hypothetical protein BDZ88DRAFT_502106 [Geranomyces variabilis]KAJ3142732.1 hypothetical protein HDU90_002603 [Geranomyces variabilis]